MTNKHKVTDSCITVDIKDIANMGKQWRFLAIIMIYEWQEKKKIGIIRTIHNVQRLSKPKLLILKHQNWQKFLRTNYNPLLTKNIKV